LEITVMAQAIAVHRHRFGGGALLEEVHE